MILYPVMMQSLKSQKKIKDIQPKLEEIKNNHKDDKEKQAKETMDLYKREKVNPFGGCLPLLLQIPIMVALYRVFWSGFDPGQMVHLYSFIPHPGEINPYFLGILDLSKTSFLLALVAGAVQFIQSKNMMSRSPIKGKEEGKTNKMSQAMEKQMMYFFPFFTVIILLRLPAAVGLYWTVTALFTLLQQKIIHRSPTEAIVGEKR